jgi:hypothetical protein
MGSTQKGYRGYAATRLDGYEATRLRGRRGHKDAEDMQVGRHMSIGKSDGKDEDVGLWRKREKRARGRY